MTCAFCYYGVVLISTEILGDTPKDIVTGNVSLLQGNGTECKNPDHKMLTPTDYVDLLWTTLAEFPGTLLSFLLIMKTLIIINNPIF